MVHFIISACGSDGSGTTNITPPGNDNEVTPLFVAGLVFKADRDTDGIEELYAANADGTEIIRLSDPLAANTTIKSFQVSADRQYVAYLISEIDVFEVSMLYVVSVNGGTPIQVSSDPIFAASPISNFVWSPDSTRIWEHNYVHQPCNGCVFHPNRRGGLMIQ